MTTLKTPTVAIFVLVFSAAVLVQDGRKVRKKSLMYLLEQTFFSDKGQCHVFLVWS